MAVPHHHVIACSAIVAPTEPTQGVGEATGHHGGDVAVPVIGDNKAKIGHFHRVLPVTIDNNLSFTAVLLETDQLLISLGRKP